MLTMVMLLCVILPCAQTIPGSVNAIGIFDADLTHNTTHTMYAYTCMYMYMYPTYTVYTCRYCMYMHCMCMYVYVYMYVCMYVSI